MRVAAARVPATIGKDGEARFRVHPGRWTLVGERAPVLREADVAAEGARVSLE